MQEKTVELRKLGNSGLEIAPLVFGGNVFGWTVDEAGASELLDRFVDVGFNMIDTADVYSNWVAGNHGGESETLIGKWLKKSGKRNRVLIATKAGLPMAEGKKGLSKKYILRSAEESLARLGIDRIDLYQSHLEDPETPQEETLAAYDELIKAGKVRAIGASNFKPATLRKALEISREKRLPRYESLQLTTFIFARSLRAERRRCAWRTIWGDYLFFAGQRISYGKVQVGKRPGLPQPGIASAKIPEPTRTAHFESSR